MTMTTENMTAPDPKALKAARLNIGRNQTQMGKLFGVCMHTWHRWETGEYAPPRKHWPRLHALVARYGGKG